MPTTPRALTANGRRLAETGAIGCNFEDQVVGTDRLYDIADQVARIAALRAGVGDDFFINAAHRSVPEGARRTP